MVKKAILKPESNMEVVWNTCKKELSGMKSVNAMKTNTKISFENLQSIKKTVFMVLLHNFLQYQFAMKSKASNKHSILKFD